MLDTHTSGKKPRAISLSRWPAARYQQRPILSMLKVLTLSAIAALCAFPCTLSAADQTQEYEQVRRIALRDPKVRAAFDRANERLEAKILEIDPSLTAYVRRGGKPAAVPAASTRPVATSTRRPAAPARTAQPAPGRRTHVVVAGDTLGAIAARYGTSASELKALNRIRDERKLAVGQILQLPGTATARTRPAAQPTRSAAPAERKSWWERL